jgi:tetratricopeptide (TPR) repeat protein
MTTADAHQADASLLHIKRETVSFLILEKIPLFVLTAISICITIYAAQSERTIASLERTTFIQQINNAIFSYVVYLKKLFWPVDLAVFYPYVDIAIWQVLVSATFLVAITIFAIKYFRRYPYLLVGWFWYLGTLVPVIGIVQVGAQAMADRYAYVPFIGLFIIIAWGGYQVLSKIRYAKVLTALVATFIVMMFAAATYSQVKVWKNSVTLFEDTLKSNPDNYLAYNVLGLEAVNRGEHELALSYYYMALKFNPKYEPAYINAGNALDKIGKFDDAIICYKKALLINNKYADANYNLGIVLIKKNDLKEAIFYLNKVLDITPDDPDAHNNLGVALMKMERTSEALIHFREALRLNPKSEEAQKNIKIAIAILHKNNKTISPY